MMITNFILETIVRTADSYWLCTYLNIVRRVHMIIYSSLVTSRERERE